ncbi:RNA 3'-terminal phosphate cyclase [Candidatus Woesearchaeota archaeon]|nr:RNA 3'-terminal phosphate cyclase [Candidatus Woesearchaeota archaeon]
MIDIDGSYLEGGGQIVRTALALSTITGKAFRIRNIRKGRKNSGLKAQHVHAIKALEKLCNAEVTGGDLGSFEVEYIPGKLQSKSVKIDIGTAGSVTLLLQSLWLPLLFGDKLVRVRVRGGTNTWWSMPVEYLQHVFLPFLRPLAREVEVAVLRRGYFPKGGGEIEVKVRPRFSVNDYDSFEAFWEDVRTSGLNFTRKEQGTLQMIQGLAHASSDLASRHVAERIAQGAKQVLAPRALTRIRVEYADTLSTGTGITLWARYSHADDVMPQVVLGADRLGELNVPAHEVGLRAARELVAAMDSGAAVDAHAADNLIPLMALLCPSTILVQNVTSHTRTNIYVCEKFLSSRFTIEGEMISSKFG